MFITMLSTLPRKESNSWMKITQVKYKERIKMPELYTTPSVADVAMRNYINAEATRRGESTMKYSQVKELITMMGRDHLVELLGWMEEDALVAALDLGLAWNIHDDFQYEGEHRSDEEFVQEMLDGTGDIPHDLPFYIHIDWTATARDIMMDYSESGGHYFRNV
jgi:hypothetical protein